METAPLSGYLAHLGLQKSSTCSRTTTLTSGTLLSQAHSPVRLVSVYIVNRLLNHHTGRSDYGPFLEVNVPSGGLFTGAEAVKTPEEAFLFGGEAGAPYGMPITYPVQNQRKC